MENITPEFKRTIALLYSYISNYLGLKSYPKLKLIKNKKNAEKGFMGYTAYYSPEKKEIVIYISNRFDTDILRSFSHECIHFFQDQTEPEFKKHRTIDQYAEKDPYLRNKEYQAYLWGNILFRQFQDEQRYGKIYQKLKLPKVC